MQQRGRVQVASVQTQPGEAAADRSTRARASPQHRLAPPPGAAVRTAAGPPRPAPAAARSGAEPAGARGRRRSKSQHCPAPPGRGSGRPGPPRVAPKAHQPSSSRPARSRTATMPAGSAIALKDLWARRPVTPVTVAGQQFLSRAALGPPDPRSRRATARLGLVVNSGHPEGPSDRLTRGLAAPGFAPKGAKGRCAGPEREDQAVRIAAACRGYNEVA